MGVGETETAGELRDRKALLVGIDSYPHFDEHHQLHGAVRDVRAVAELLTGRLDFHPDDVEVLTDGAATRAGILAALERLLERVAPDDAVVVHYSGHGSRRYNPESRDADLHDEVLVPSDSGHADPAPNRDVSCRELYDWLLRLSRKTATVTLIFDCCHSGTITRDPFADRERWLPPDERAVPEPEVSGGEPAPSGRLEVGPSGWLPPARAYTLLAACRADERAREMRVRGGEERVHHGAFTYFLCRELSRAPLDAGVTYRDLFERVTLEVTARYRSQHPQLEGAGDRELFGLRELPPMRHLQVTARQGSLAVLGGGAIHRVGEGSVWAVYPREVKRRAPGVEPLGHVRVTAVRSQQSDATVLEEARPGAVVPWSRAVEEVPAVDAAPLRIDIQTPPEGAPEELRSWLSEVREEIGYSLPLTLAEDGDADLRIYALEPRERAGAGDPVPAVSSVAAASAAAVGRDGEPVVPLRRLDEPSSALLMVENLESYVRHRRMLRLENPAPNPLAGQVELEILRRAEDGSWIAADPEGPGGEVAFLHDEPFAVEIRHRCDGPIFVYLLDLGIGGAVDLLFPSMPGAREPLEPGHTITIGIAIGDRPTEPLVFRVPDTFPFDEPGRRPAGGIEVLKLIATTEEADLRSAFQGSYRSPVGGGKALEGSSLGAILNQLMLDTRREVLRAPSRRDGHWTTVERRVLLRRP